MKKNTRKNYYAVRASRTRAKPLHFEETPFGFEWGAAKIMRGFSDEKKGWVTLLIETPKHPGGDALQVYVTATGKVRVYDPQGSEWEPPKVVRPRNRPVGGK